MMIPCTTDADRLYDNMFLYVLVLSNMRVYQIYWLLTRDSPIVTQTGLGSGPSSSSDARGGLVMTVARAA